MKLNYYQILGVSEYATDSEIKKAYQRLAMKYHPDRNLTVDHRIFQEISEAYTVLSDPEKRKDYDYKTGNPYRRNDSDYHEYYSNKKSYTKFSDSDWDDIFKDLGKYQKSKRQYRSTQNIYATINVTMNEVVNGKQRTIAFEKGSNFSGARIDIPVGVVDGEEVSYAGVVPDGSNLVVTFLIDHDPEWAWDGNVLKFKLRISIWTLLIGGTVSFKTLDNKEFLLKIPSGTQPNAVFRLPNKGIKKSKSVNTSDLLVELDPYIPNDMSKDLVEDLAKVIQKHC